VIPGNQILIFVVWAGETIPGPLPYEAATYIGYSPPIIMQGQDFAVVPLSMNLIQTGYFGPPPSTMNFQVINGQNDAVWSLVPSADYYEVYDGFGSLIYQGPGTSCHFPSPVSSARARFCSSVFGICSDFVNFTT